MEQAILIAYDGSEHADVALRTAVTMAKTLDAKLTLLNVQPNIETHNVRRFFDHETVMEYLNEKATEEVQPAVQFLEESGVSFEKKFKIGNPVVQIVETAREENTQYIVMGSRGMGLISGMVLGSVSYGVLHESPCPVVIVPKKA